jgi:hypothetical protein
LKLQSSGIASGESAGWYHVFGRGLDRRGLFADDLDRMDCVELLSELHERCRHVIHAWVEMDTHYHLSFVSLPIALDPAAAMASRRVVMRPVNDTPTGIPFIFAIELDSVPECEGCDSRGQIYVVRNQECLPCGQSNNESLVSASIVVI